MNPWGFPWRASVFSLVLHALILTGLAPLLTVTDYTVTPTGASRRLQVVMLNAPPAISTPSPAQDPPEVVRQPSTLASVKKIPVIAPRTARVVAVPPAPTFPPASADAAQTASSGASNVSAPSVAEQSATAARLDASAEPVPDAAGLRQFRLSLAGEARRFRRYPETARRGGLSGTAEIRVSVTAGGTVRSADLNHSSGDTALDAAALEMLQQAVRHVSLPASLRDQSFAVLLSVVFEVDE